LVPHPSQTLQCHEIFAFCQGLLPIQLKHYKGNVLCQSKGSGR
jgi:hypothetical protein